jgi:post-segregation antitoxin (ccd killing protein)
MADERYKTRSTINLTLSKDVKDYLEERTKETDVPISRYVDRLVREAMEREKASKE